MERTYDVIIAGCGPAGSIAGHTLARRGFKVAMLDRAQFPRKKLCGGLLTWKSSMLIERVLGHDSEALKASGVINYASDEYTIRTYKTTLAQGRLPAPFHFVDRTVFDHFLLNQAKEAGAEVFESAKVVSCDPEQASVTMENGETFKGQHLIGTDGVNSVIRGSFPNLNRERWKEFLAPAIEISMDRNAFPRPVEHPELVVGFLDAGYGWIFPNQDRIVLGICGLKQKNSNFSDVFRQYLDFLQIDKTVVGEFHGHPLPYGNYLGNPVCGPTILAGDAAGLVEPLFGEGIFFALASGLYAGEAVADSLDRRGPLGPIYLRRLHDQIMPELKASDKLRWMLFKAMKYTGSSSLGLFVNAGKEPLAQMVHGMRSYAWLRKKKWDFM